MGEPYIGHELGHWTTRAAESYQELARVFSSYVSGRETQEKKEYDRLAAGVTERLCRDCPKKEWCREVLEEERQTALNVLLKCMEVEGKTEPDWMPEFFVKECMCGEKVVDEIQTVLYLERMRRSAYNQMMEGKEALVYQLEETAKYLRQMEQTFQREQYLSEEKKRELMYGLRKYHVRARELETMHRIGKGRELLLHLRCDGAKRAMSMRLVERLLSEELGFPVRACSQARGYLSETEQQVLFREEPGYSVMTGVARMVKEEQQVSGDSFSFFYENEGEMAMILSDGMGSGEEAARESEAVLLLLERMLSAGFREEAAIRLINSVLALRAEQKMFATLDISRINLYSGTCEFIKIGGAATYLRRGKWLECVEAKTLPIGMVQKVDYDFLVKKLYDGDYIIMMSDGVLDVVPEQERVEFLRQIIGEETSQNPQVLAGRILNASLLMQNFEPKDDMTVLVCGVVQKK
ncbi:MAG: SpoIIE family protein phosphatase [Lachnospiraceae bacterium]|nr:SpoIIE family protein phosphatase [Lachnospiraceae bacterium]MBP3611505.1 SpoIIE family protein phosphatase [Lachnospiraceae bacterium]